MKMELALVFVKVLNRYDFAAKNRCFLTLTKGSDENEKKNMDSVALYQHAAYGV